jgi:hypothetical protein
MSSPGSGKIIYPGKIAASGGACSFTPVFRIIPAAWYPCRDSRHHATAKRKYMDSRVVYGHFHAPSARRQGSSMKGDVRPADRHARAGVGGLAGRVSPGRGVAEAGAGPVATQQSRSIPSSRGFLTACHRAQRAVGPRSGSGSHRCGRTGQFSSGLVIGSSASAGWQHDPFRATTASAKSSGSSVSWSTGTRKTHGTASWSFSEIRFSSLTP